jgi:hypothetical protein
MRAIPTRSARLARLRAFGPGSAAGAMQARTMLLAYQPRVAATLIGGSHE